MLTVVVFDSLGQNHTLLEKQDCPPPKKIDPCSKRLWCGIARLCDFDQGSNPQKAVNPAW